MRKMRSWRSHDSRGVAGAGLIPWMQEPAEVNIPPGVKNMMLAVDIGNNVGHRVPAAPFNLPFAPTCEGMDSVLIDNDQSYRQLVENITDYAIYMLDPEGRIASWNAGARAIKGYDRDEVIGRHFSCFYSEEERRAGLPDRGLAAARQEGRYVAEGWRIRRDGSAFWASVVIDAVHEGGALIGFAKITRDMTERKRYEDELVHARQQTEQRNEELGVLSGFLNTVIDNIPTWVIVQDHGSGRVLLSNHDELPARPGKADERIGQASRPAQILAHLEAQAAEVMTTGRCVETEIELDTGAVPSRLKCRILILQGGEQHSGHLMYLIEDVTEEHAANELIRHMAHHDALTNLPNRMLFGERLGQALRHADDREQRVGTLLLDLDNFKDVNDVLGHQAGDELLGQLAGRLGEALNAGETLARIGGDEFAVVAPACRHHAEVEDLARQLVSVSRSPFFINGHQIQTGISIGIALSSEGVDSAEQLFRQADLALYEAKRNGRNQYEFFRCDMEEVARHRLDVETDLRQALTSHELLLYYQPIKNSANMALSGYEALLRWNHPTKGLIPPLQFIPIAEETGLIHEIGMWVLVEACREAMRWPPEQVVSVNLSPIQFGRRNLVDRVKGALATSGLAPQRLELEITESVLLDETQRNLETLRQLKQLGVRIVLDDFGTGYSSLRYLRTFPFDKIKIDKSFINEVCESREALAIVRAITSMSRSLDIETTAEGVERAEQVDLLQREGCSHLQGYLFGRPGRLDILDEGRVTLSALQQGLLPAPDLQPVATTVELACTGLVRHQREAPLIVIDQLEAPPGPDGPLLVAEYRDQEDRQRVQFDLCRTGMTGLVQFEPVGVGDAPDDQTDGTAFHVLALVERALMGHPAQHAGIRPGLVLFIMTGGLFVNDIGDIDEPAAARGFQLGKDGFDEDRFLAHVADQAQRVDIPAAVTIDDDLGAPLHPEVMQYQLQIDAPDQQHAHAGQPAEHGGIGRDPAPACCDPCPHSATSSVQGGRSVVGR
ncbi:PAS domain S-box-containing protein/diguanylate cyclase (GGDEF)-like protein [Kushneria sinocarnis]|uniref:PAS domain S-box-containing protein/diguanylate cyclase (GGDEF)-like protein n=1 Tax=Kushneria sinocarnis TaxID=595502 RepID=A0A420WWQ8_9GAMM|nr:PAS domain S-box-containing protein/diguanylate cyclase (GGDEF)-like protein [Kushneria sinocarnis]